MKRRLLKVTLFGLIVFSSCGKLYKNDSAEYASTLNTEEISSLNKNIDNDEDIIKFIPSSLKDDEELIQYITKSEDSFDKFYLKAFDVLDTAAEFKKSKDDIKKIDNSDASSVGKGALNVGKMIAKGVWSGGKLLMSSSFLFDYKKDYNKLNERYSERKKDSLKYVMKYIAIRNFFYDQFNSRESELIESGDSVWSINLLPDDIEKKVNFEESLELYKKLKLESNQVIKVLIFNKMKGIDCSPQINNQTEELISFWNSDQETYKNDFNLFEDYFEILSDLKTNISQTEKYINKNKDGFNEKIISDINNFIVIYNAAIIQNINDLNIYERIPSAESEIKKKIREGSDVYFE